MLKESEIRNMSDQLSDAVVKALHNGRPNWHLDRLQGAQKTLAIVMDLLGSTARGETNLDCWERFLKTGN